MLTLVGLGLWDENDLTLRGIDVIKKADEVYIETYTSKWQGNVQKIEKITGKKIINLNRRDLEEDYDKILKKAKNSDLVILVAGDPLIATTHTSLLLEAKKIGIKTKIVHNSSIYSAVGESGLHVYKFGRTATIPYLKKTGGKLPISVYKVIEENKNKGFHTLLLLDIENKGYLTPNQAMEILLKIEEKMKKEVFTEDSRIVVLTRLGSDDPKIIYGEVKNLVDENFGGPPFVLIVPGELHFTESEYLEYYSISKGQENEG